MRRKKDPMELRVYTNISLPAWLDNKLREVLPARKGAFSAFIEEAVIEKLEKEGLLDEGGKGSRVR